MARKFFGGRRTSVNFERLPPSSPIPTRLAAALATDRDQEQFTESECLGAVTRGLNSRATPPITATYDQSSRLDFKVPNRRVSRFFARTVPPPLSLPSPTDARDYVLLRSVRRTSTEHVVGRGNNSGWRRLHTRASSSLLHARRDVK